MNVLAIYSQADGRFLRAVGAATPEFLALQVSSGEVGLMNIEQPHTQYLENGVLHPMGPRPDTNHIFNYTIKQWVDARSEQQKLDDATHLALTRRSSELAASDWTQIPNNPLSPALQQQWATYRQALRDITEQPGYPLTIDWPTPPQ